MVAGIQKFLSSLPLPLWVRKVFKIAQILNHDMNRCDLFKHASAMAYVTLFSLIPSLAAVFALIALFQPFMGENSSLLVKVRQFVFDNLATGSGEQLMKYLEGFIANLNLTRIGMSGFAGMIVTLVLLLRQIELALNRIWLVKHPRHVVTRFIYFWTFLTLGTFIIGLSVGVLSGFHLDNLIPFGNHISVERGLVAKITPFLSIFVFFTLLYKVVPNCFVSLKHAAIGAFPAAVLWVLAGRLYGWYAANFTNYAAIYGALAAVPLFLLWLYIIWLITLFGALLAWRVQQSFDLPEDLDDESPVLTPQERLRNHRLQTLTPYLTLLAIYDNFAQGKGQGLGCHEIATKLNIPMPWVNEALEALLEMKYIVQSQQTPGADTTSNPDRFFPTCPAASISLDQLRQTFTAASRQWLDQWVHEWPVDLKQAVSSLWDDEQRSTSQGNLAEVLQRLPKTVSANA